MITGSDPLIGYDGAWDGKKCSTLGKLESAIWARYENELKAKYKSEIK